MDLRSIVWTSRKLAFCSLLVACVAAGGCLDHVYIGGAAGGDGEGGGTGGAGSGAGNGASASGSGEAGRTDSGDPAGGSSGSGGSGGSGLLCPYHGTPCGGDSMVDLTFNPHHCGACGHDCGPNAGCYEGQCVSLQGECQTCASAVTPQDNVPGGPLCQPTSQPIYDALIDCVCGSVCGAVCGDNVCACGEASNECLDCIHGAQASCIMQFNECANDV